MKTSLISNPKKKRMLTSSAKSKGRKLQDLVRDSLRSHLIGINPTFTLDRLNLGIKSAIMGESGCDVMITDLEFRNLIPFDIECKNCEKWNMSSFWNQTIANCDAARIPLLVLKKNRSEVLCTLRFVDLLRLLK